MVSDRQLHQGLVWIDSSIRALFEWLLMKWLFIRCLNSLGFYLGTPRGEECRRVAPRLPRWVARGWRPLPTQSDRTSSTPGGNRSGWRTPESVGYKCLREEGKNHNWKEAITNHAPSSINKPVQTAISCITALLQYKQVSWAAPTNWSDAVAYFSVTAPPAPVRPQTTG